MFRANKKVLFLNVEGGFLFVITDTVIDDNISI